MDTFGPGLGVVVAGFTVWDFDVEFFSLIMGFAIL